MGNSAYGLGLHIGKEEGYQDGFSDGENSGMLKGSIWGTIAGALTTGLVTLGISKLFGKKKNKIMQDNEPIEIYKGWELYKKRDGIIMAAKDNRVITATDLKHAYKMIDDDKEDG